LLNRTVRAEEAVAWGLASEIVAADALAERAADAARKIAAYPRGTMRAAKSLLWGDRALLAADLEAERARFVELVAAPEALAGVDVFLRDFADYPDSQDEEEAKC
jgi:2-(1,2-epoxy-1,2-dihydrophenyl)acetyl-CoA isomerase